MNEFLYNGSKWELGRTRDPFPIKILFWIKWVIYNQLLLYIHMYYRICQSQDGFVLELILLFKVSKLCTKDVLFQIQPGTVVYTWNLSGSCASSHDSTLASNHWEWWPGSFCSQDLAQPGLQNNNSSVNLIQKWLMFDALTNIHICYKTEILITVSLAMPFKNKAVPTHYNYTQGLMF